MQCGLASFLQAPVNLAGVAGSMDARLLRVLPFTGEDSPAAVPGRALRVRCRLPEMAGPPALCPAGYRLPTQVTFAGNAGSNASCSFRSAVTSGHCSRRAAAT